MSSILGNLNNFLMILRQAINIAINIAHAIRSMQFVQRKPI